MTRKIYDDHVYQSTAEAIVTNKIIDNDQHWYAFNQTIFYPEGGGQGCDLGHINNVRVLDVQKRDNDIYHRVEEEIIDEQVVMEIDMSRRLDHMQQHCAEHILSGLLFDEFGLVNVGFHMSEDLVTIDVNQRDFKGDDLVLLESMANRVVRANLPVEVSYYYQLESDEGLDLRKHLTVTENVRIVRIPGVDAVACGGTHPHHTGDVGSIKILKSENNKKGTRITFVAGNRASKMMNKIYSQWQNTAQILSTDVNGYQEALGKLVEKQEAMMKTLKEKNLQLVELMHLTKPVEVFEVYDQGQTMEIKELLAEKRLSSGTELVLLADKDAIRFSITHKEAIPKENLEKFKELLAQHDGKGGGNAKKFQGKFQNVANLEKFIIDISSYLK